MIARRGNRREPKSVNPHVIKRILPLLGVAALAVGAYATQASARETTKHPAKVVVGDLT